MHSTLIRTDLEEAFYDQGSHCLRINDRLLPGRLSVKHDLFEKLTNKPQRIGKGMDLPPCEMKTSNPRNIQQTVGI